ncbi:MAG: hypothetical protein ACQCN5_10525 [Candidatus Bathyarchaeia archaeon]|jgi:hypothetical protein
MATSIAKATELGFAEFASTLISETLNAVVTSILTQEKQAAELEKQTLLSPEEYAKENLTDEIVRAEIMRLFPSSTGKEEKSAVDVGEPYTVSKETGESPAINEKTGYKIAKTDVTPSTQNMLYINQTGYNNIYSAVRLTLAAQHLALLRQVIARGIPRVYVDNGHIKSKLMLRLENQSPATTKAATTGSRIASLSLPKLIAQPVNATKPEYLTLKADVLSEVEITFKTVVP